MKVKLGPGHVETVVATVVAHKEVCVELAVKVVQRFARRMTTAVEREVGPHRKRRGAV
jgi:aromatic ring-cleaving dioxygenase